MAPRLPDDSVLGQLPQAISHRPVASFDTTGPGRAMESMGKGIQNLGQGIGQGIQAYADRQERQSVIDETTAKSQRQVNTLNLLDKANNSNDPNEVRGYVTELEKNDQTTLARIKDPERRQKTEAEFAVDTTKQRIKLGERAKFLDDKNFTDGMNNEVEEARRKALDTQDPDVREVAKKVLDRKIEEAVTRRILTPDEAIARKRKWYDEFAWDAVKLMPPQDAAIALTKIPEASAPLKEKQKIAFQFFLAKGWTPVQAAGMAGGFTHESKFNTEANNPKDGRDGSDSIAIGQWNSNRAQQLKWFASQNRTSWNDFKTQLEFAQWELENTERGAAAALRSTNNLRDATSVFSDKYFRPAGSGKGGYDALNGWASRYGHASKIAEEFGGLPPDPNVSRLQALGSQVPPEKRQQLFDLQEREFNQQRKVAFDTEVADRAVRVNALELSIIDGKAGRIEVDAARESGDVMDADKVAKLYRMVEERDKKDSDVRYFVGKVERGERINPLDKADTDGAEAAVDAMAKTNKISKPRAAMDVFEQSGGTYLPKSGAAAVRGALISNDVDTVADAANIASNMFARNPNAFSGAQGEKDLETAAVDFQHFTNDLAMSREDAARRIMLEQSAEYKAKVKVQDGEVKKFNDDLRKNAVTDLKKASFPGSAWLLGSNDLGAPKIRDAVSQDYAELATKRYQETGDVDGAKRYAVAQLSKMWGVTQGERMMKFPPELARGYPKVDGSHSYVYRQAAEAIKDARGHDVDPKNIVLMEAGKVQTAEAFRSGAPVPYTIMYFRKNEDGYLAPEYVYGRDGDKRKFAADPKIEYERVKAEQQKAFEQSLSPRGPAIIPQASAADMPTRSMKPGRPELSPEQRATMATEQNAATAARAGTLADQEAMRKGLEKATKQETKDAVEGGGTLRNFIENTPKNPLKGFVPKEPYRGKKRD